MDACQRSLPAERMGVRRHSLSSAARHNIATTRVSCPSEKTSASTITGSPMTRLAAKRPSSTLGTTCSITMRGIAASLPGRASVRRALTDDLPPARSMRTSPPASEDAESWSAEIASSTLRLAPAVGGKGLSVIGTGYACSRSELIMMTATARASRTSAVSDRMSTVTGVFEALRRRISPTMPSAARRPLSALASRMSVERSMLSPPLIAQPASPRDGFPVMSSSAANSKPIGTIRPSPVAAAQRSRCRYTAGKSAAFSKRRAKRGPNGASGQAMTAPIPRRSSCSSANQPDRRSHHGNDENAAAKPQARRPATASQSSPGVHAKNRQSGNSFSTPAMICRHTAGGTC
jgi:hypothetical protein